MILLQNIQATEELGQSFNPQPNYRELFSVPNILKSSGFDVKSIGQAIELLLPSVNLTGTNASADLLFECFNSEKYRAEIAAISLSVIR